MSVVCLDLDGTLIDSVPDLASAMNRLHADLGLSAIDGALIRRLIGRGARDLVRRVHHHIGEREPEDIDALAGRFVAYYQEVLTDSTACFPGALEALGALRDHGHRLALTTNKPSEPTQKIIHHLGLEPYFDVVLAGDSLSFKKPDPRHLTEAVARCGGGGAVMVGDSGTDAAAAHAAGMPLVAVSFGYRPGPLSDLRAATVIDSLHELPAAVAAVMPRG